MRSVLLTVILFLSIACTASAEVYDLTDLWMLSGEWLFAGPMLDYDLDHDHDVDLRDYSILAANYQPAGPDGPQIIYTVEDCNVDAPPAQNPESGTRFEVRVSGRDIILEDMVHANCCSYIYMFMTLDGNHITVHELEDNYAPCDCECDFPVSATLGPFEPDTYRLEVIDVNGASLGIVQVIIQGSDPGMSFHIEPCDMFAGPSAQAFPLSENTRFTITVDGIYLHFEDMMTANCCPDRLWLDMELVGSTIVIFEHEFTPAGCYCICDFPVTATFGPFWPGSYTVEVYEDYGGFIGAAPVEIE